MRRTLALLLTVVMLVSMLSFGTSAGTTYVAKIIKSDTTERGQYTNIDTAIAALQDGDTLVLLKNLTANKTISAKGKNITITADSGVIITSKLSFSTASVASNGNITLKDLTLKNTHCAEGANLLAIYQYNNVVIDNCNITLGGTSGTPIAIMTGNSSDKTKSVVSLTIKNSNITVSGNAYAMFARSENKITVEDTVFTTTASNHMIGINLSISGGYANFVRCKFNVKSSVYAFNASTSYVTASFKDCTFSTTKNKTILNLTSGCHATFDNVAFNIPSTYSSATYVMTGNPYMSLLSASFANSSANNIKIANFSSADMSSGILVPSNSVLEWTVGNDKLVAAAEINSAAIDVADMESVAATAITEINKLKSSEAIAARKALAINEILNDPKTDAEIDFRNSAYGATDPRVFAALSSAIETLWDATINTVAAVEIEKQKGIMLISDTRAKADAESTLKTVASGATDQRVLDLLSSAIADVWNAENSSDVITIEMAYISNIELVKLKLSAEAELREAASGATDQRILDILSSAIANVWDETNSTAISVDEAKQKGNISIGNAMLKLDAEKELKAVASGATDQRVLDVLSNGIANVWNSAGFLEIAMCKNKQIKYINLALDKLAAEEELKELTSTATDQRVLDVLSSSISFIWDATEDDLQNRKNFRIKLINLAIAKVAAEKEVDDYSEGSSSPAVVEIVSSATEEIWSTGITTTDAVDKIVADAKVKMDAYKSKITAEAEIREYASSATDERILEIVSSACAEIWNKATSSAVLEFQQETYAKIDLINAKIAAVAAINAAAGEDEILQLYADIFIDAVNDSEDAQAVETFKQKAVNAFALVKAKAAAIKQLNSILGNEDEAIRAIASASIDEVKSSGTLTAEQVAEILSKAIADIEFEAYKNDAQAAVKAVEDAQNAAVVEIVSNAIANIEVATTKVAIDEIKSNALADVALEKAKAAAIKVVEDEDVKSSAVAAGIASQAIADIKVAKTIETVETIKSAAIADIRAQLAAEALAAAKEAAIAEINSEAISSSAAMEAIVSGAIADVNAANTLEAVETARSAAIVAIRAQLVAEAPKTADSTVWFVIVAAVAMLGCATVAKKKFF